MKHPKHWLVLWLVIIPFLSQGQNLDASPAGIMISHGHPKGGWMLTYTYQHSELGHCIDGTATVSDEKIYENYLMSPQNMKMDMHMLMGMYGASGRLSFMAMIMYNQMNMNMSMMSGTSHLHNGVLMTTPTNMTMTTSGFGDVRLWAICKLANGERSSLIASFGLSLPFGRNDLKGNSENMFSGQHLPYSMQIGTGTLDFLPGVSYYKNAGKISWSMQALGSIRFLPNMYNYTRETDLTINLWAARKFGKHLSISVRSENYWASVIDGVDEYSYSGMEPDSDPENYGGIKSNALLGVNYYINSGFLKDSKIGAEGGIPVFQNLNGPQQKSSYQFIIGITKSF
ncbi:MAG: hypothetical protein U0X76_12895 [Bacteroidia bacterium]